MSNFVYRQYKGYYFYNFFSNKYMGIIEKKLCQINPIVEIEYNILFSSDSEENLMEKITDKINELENQNYEEI